MGEVDRQIFKQARWLTQALIISGALNIGLILALFLLFVKDKIVPEVLDHRPVYEETLPLSKGHNNADEILKLEALSFEQLISKLNNKKLVEDGFMQRDLSLGLLVSKYHFDISKALAPKTPHPRILALGNKAGLVTMRVKVFPGLSDEEFSKMLHFAKTERWPLTSQGLFLQIQEKGQEAEESLLNTFYLTPEFIEVETLFQRQEIQQDRKKLLDILKTGDWQMIEGFAKSQKEAKDLSQARHQRFLLDYIHRNSKDAAYIMLQMHGSFAVKKLDDAHVIAILELMDEKNAYSEAFAKAMLLSPRSDAVWRVSAKRLFQFSDQEMPEPYDHMKVLAKFIPEDILKNKMNIAKEVVTKEGIAQKNIAPLTKKQISKTDSLSKPEIQTKINAASKIQESSKESKKSSSTSSKDLLVSKELIKPVKIESKTSKTENKELKTEIKVKTHTVLEGETLWLIAKKYNVDVALIKSYNKLSNDTIKVGRVLVIPIK